MKLSNNKKNSPKDKAGSQIAPHQFARKTLITPGKKTSLGIPDPPFTVSMPSQSKPKKDQSP